MFSDLFNRKIDYLRLSVTDLCNLRCSYCMPLEGVFHRERAEILTFEEIDRMVRILASLGICRVRLTGGEPLVRKELPRLISLLTGIERIEEVLLTTNGVLLKQLARSLKESGLKKINIHLDTLNPERFESIARRGRLQQVLDGIEEARSVGLSPIKINMVVQRGVNDGEVEALLHFSRERRLLLRLIELMPIGPARESPENFISCGELREKLAERYTLLPLGIRRGSGPAVYYRVAELETDIGFISPVSQPFCEGCNRIRIAADGRFQDCLAYDGSFSLRDLLRDPEYSDEEIAQVIADLLQGKRESHFNFIQREGIRTPCMYGIGG